MRRAWPALAALAWAALLFECGPEPCGPSNCPKGRCNKSGACVTTPTNTQCGTGGLTCADCASKQQTCSPQRSCVVEDGGTGGGAGGGGGGAGGGGGGVGGGGVGGG